MIKQPEPAPTEAQRTNELLEKILVAIESLTMAIINIDRMNKGEDPL